MELRRSNDPIDKLNITADKALDILYSSAKSMLFFYVILGSTLLEINRNIQLTSRFIMNHILYFTINARGTKRLFIPF